MAPPMLRSSLNQSTHSERRCKSFQVNILFFPAWYTQKQDTLAKSTILKQGNKGQVMYQCRKNTCASNVNTTIRGASRMGL